jgi:hypothetical protein
LVAGDDVAAEPGLTPENVENLLADADSVTEAEIAAESTDEAAAPVESTDETPAPEEA